MLIVGIDPEELVLDERSAGRETVNLAQVLRFEMDGRTGVADQQWLRGEIVHGVPVTFAIPEVGLAVDLVGAALRDGGNDASGGAAVLSRVDASIDGKLAHCGSRSGIRLAGTSAFLREEGLVVIGAVDFNVVEKRADEIGRA